MEIRVSGQNIERALKLLKREAEKEGLFRELKKRRFYEKPSVKKRSKQREAQKRRVKTARLKRQYRQSSASSPGRPGSPSRPGSPGRPGSLGRPSSPGRPIS